MRGIHERSPAETGLWYSGANRMTAAMVAEEMASPDSPLLLDVRNVREWETRHIGGSVNVPLNQLQQRIAEIPRNRRITVHCAGGYRSSIAASILHQYGITHLVEMAGGIAAWDAASLSLVPAAHDFWHYQPSITKRRKRMSLRINDQTPIFRRDHPGHNQLPRMDRQWLGRSVFAPQGLYSCVHH